MSQRNYQVNVTLKAESQLGPIKETDAALKKVGETAKKTNEELNKVNETPKPSQPSTPDLNPGNNPGEGGIPGMPKMPDLFGKLDMTSLLTNGALMAGAVMVGKKIGAEVEIGLRHWAQGGTLEEFWDSTWARLGEATGIESWSFPQQLRDVMTGAKMALQDNALDWQNWVKEVNKAKPDDAINRLEKLVSNLGQVKAGLSDLSALENARKEAAMAAIDQNEQDALYAVQRDTTKTAADRTFANLQIREEAEKQRLAERTKSRETQATLSRGNVGVAEADLNEKKAIEAAQAERAKIFQEIMGVAKSAAYGLDGEGKTQAMNQGFSDEAKRRGVNMSIERDEKAQYEKVKEARVLAEREVEFAKARDKANRERLAIEQQSDITTTERRMQRDRLQAEDTGAKQLEQEVSAVPGPVPEPDAGPQRDTSGEDAAGAVLTGMAQGTNDAGRKAEFEEMRRKLQDGEVTSRDKAQLEELIGKLADTKTDQGTTLANKLAEALSLINQKDAEYRAAIQRVEEEQQRLAAKVDAA